MVVTDPHKCYTKFPLGNKLMVVMMMMMMMMMIMMKHSQGQGGF
jgi:hypothetical protein